MSAGLGSDPPTELSQLKDLEKSIWTVISFGKREKAEEANLTS